ncbi:MAG TPA: oligosaccharide flippase family protein [Gemmatimonadaceae bacterium]
MTARTAPASKHFRLTDGVVLGFAAELILLPTGLVTAAVLTRTLGPRGYGVFSVAATFITWLGFTTTTLLARAAVKFVSEADVWRPVATGVLRWRLAIGGLAALVVALASVPIARVLGESTLAPYLAVFAIDLLLFNLARAHRDVLTGRGRFREVAAVSAARWTSRLVFIVVLVRLTGSVMGAVVGSVGATLVELLVARWREPIPFRGHSTVTRSMLWSVAAPLMLYGVSQQLYSRIDLFALSALSRSPVDAGLYAAAQNLAVAPGLFALAIGPLLLATLTRLRRSGAEDQARRVGRDALRVTIGLVPLAAIVAGAAPEIVRVIFGASFVASGPLLALLFAGGVALALMTVAVSIITAIDQQRVVSMIGLAVLAAAVVGHLVMIPRFGALGAATVTTACGTMGALVSLACVHRMWGVHAYATMARAAALALPAYWLASHLAGVGGGLLVLVLALGLMTAGVAVAFVVLGELDAAERRRWRAVWPSGSPAQAGRE